MQSQHGHLYNHDPWAHNYDDDVQNEADPIRTGYEATLNWVIAQADVQPSDYVLELGSGTGNLTVRIPTCRQITCVDLSEKMTVQAREKLGDRPNIHFVQADVLAYLADEHLHSAEPQVDAIISTYTIHHLTEPEKQQMFAYIEKRLKPGGRAIFGDLMIADQATEPRVQQYFRDSGHPGVAEDIEKEFFWYVDSAQAGLEALGFQVQIERFSTLSWGIVARKATWSNGRLL